MPAGLLGAHVGRRAHDRAAGRQLDVGLDALGQAEVGDVRVTLLVDQDVRRLQVAMEDAAHVGVLDGFGRLDHQGHGRAEIVPERGELIGEVAPLDELHAEIALAVVLADFVNRDDAGVVEQRDGLGLVLEPAQVGVVGQHAGLDHLEGDGSVEADLPGLVDDAHAAAAQLFLNLVIAEVADGGAARQVGRGPAAVVCPGKVIGLACSVAGGFGPGRGCARDPPLRGCVRSPRSGPGWIRASGRRPPRLGLCCHLAHPAARADALRSIRGL